MKTLMLIGLLFISGTALAQDFDSHSKDSSSNSWVQLGFGPAFYNGGEQATTGLLMVTKRFGQNLYSLRAALFTELFSGYSDFGFMYGRIIPTANESFNLSAHAGISSVSKSGTNFGLFGGPSGSERLFRGVGVPLQVQGYYKLSKYWSLSAAWMGNINSDAMLSGFGFGFQFGDLN